jgi:1,3-beta-glucan synthase
VVRYAIMYFLMFVLFIVLIVGPVIVKQLGVVSPTLGADLPMNLMQPANWNNNDTSGKVTGTALAGGRTSASATRAGTRPVSTRVSNSNNNRMMFMM